MSRGAVTTLAVAGIGLALIGLSVVRHSVPMLVWNASASVPVGLYRMASGEPKLGDFVLVRMPDSVAALAAERGYLPAGIPLVKPVAGMAGDRVCAVGLTVLLNGKKAAQQLERDRESRVLPRWQGCHKLADGEVFLLADAPDSFDSRTFGPVLRSSIMTRLVPLWTE